MSDKKTANVKAMEMIQAVHNDKCATINGRDYVLTNINHIRRRKVFAFYSSIANQIGTGDMSFIDSKEYLEVEKVINDIVLFDGSSISKIKDHWDDFPEDYIMYVTTMLSVISYPFLRGKITS